MTEMEMHTEQLKYHERQFRRRPLDSDRLPRVLIVEDDEVAMEALSYQIRRYDANLEVLTASSTAEALRLMEYRPPDLLITDYYLDNDSTAVDLIRMAAKASRPIGDTLVVSTGAPLPALFAAEREGLSIKFVKKPVDRFLLYRFLQFDLDRGYYL